MSPQSKETRYGDGSGARKVVRSANNAQLTGDPLCSFLNVARAKQQQFAQILNLEASLLLITLWIYSRLL